MKKIAIDLDEVVFDFEMYIYDIDKFENGSLIDNSSCTFQKDIIGVDVYD